MTGEIRKTVQIGDNVELDEDIDSIIPKGRYVVSKVNPDGSFHVGGNTAVWPSRIVNNT